MNTDNTADLVLEYTPEAPRFQDIGNRLPLEYIQTLPHHDNIDALRGCLTVYRVTSCAIVPRVFQVQASLAMLDRRHTIITAVPGSGRTLCQLIPMFLRPDTLSITISPLKRLQITLV